MSIRVQKWQNKAYGDGDWIDCTRVSSTLDSVKFLKALDVYGKVSEDDWDNYEQMGMVLDRFVGRFDDLVTFVSSEGGPVLRLDRGHLDMRGRFNLSFYKGMIDCTIRAYMEIDLYGTFRQMPLREIVGAIEGIHAR